MEGGAEKRLSLPLQRKERSNGADASSASTSTESSMVSETLDNEQSEDKGGRSERFSALISSSCRQ